MVASTDPLARMLEGLADRVEGLKGDDRAAYDDLEFFSRYVIGWDNPRYKVNSPFLKKIYETLQHSPDDDLLILGPRGSAKSSAISVTYTAWRIGRNPLVLFLLAFASAEKQGFAFSRQLQQIITGNPRFSKIFGELKPPATEKWTESEFIVKRPTPPSGLKDPTVAIVGLGSNVPSKRSDEIIVDDIVTAENAYSPILRAKVERFVIQTLFPTCVPTGRKIIVGSRWDPRDLYGTMAERWNLEFPEVQKLDLHHIIELTG